VKPDVPGAPEGVPESVPEPESVTPVGRPPAEMLNAYGPTPPLTAMDDE
jgi:hypothetical protein